MSEKSQRVLELEAALAQLSDSQKKERVDILVQLAWESGFERVDRGFDLNQEAVALAREISYEHGLAMTDHNLGFYYYAKSRFEKALEKATAAADAFERMENPDMRANSTMVLGLIYWSLGNFELSLKYLHESERHFKKVKNTDRLPWTLTTLGGVLENLQDYDKALAYHGESLDFFRQNEDVLGEARALSGMGTVYQSQGNYARALEYERKSLALFQRVGSRLGEARAYNDLGMAFQGMGKLADALDYHKKSLGIREELDNKNSVTTSLLNMGRVYNLMQQPGKALEVLTQALSYTQELNAKSKMYQVHMALSTTYENLGDLDNALAHLKLQQSVREEVFGDEARTRLQHLEIQFEVEKARKEAEIHRLRNIELKQALDELRATQAQLIQAGKMALLGQLTAGIAHEINNPISAVKSAADLWLRGLQRLQEEPGSGSSGNGDARAKTIGILQQNSQTTLAAVKRIDKIVKSLRNFSRLDEAEFKKVNIHEGIESTLTLLEHKLGPRIKVNREYSELPLIAIFPNQMNQVFMTVLKNAIQAVDGSGMISIVTAVNGDHVVIRIADDGKGMSQEVVQSLFDLSFKTKARRVGVGLGLYTAHDIVARHDGKIDVKSKVGQGTEFTIQLPMR